MTKFLVAAATALALSACSGGSNPFSAGDTGTDTGGTGTDTGGPIDSDRTLPPGTPSPGANTSIYRSEPTSTETGYQGNGYASNISYDATNDTFTVDNLAFDGDNTYARGTKVGSLAGKYAVYEADQQFTDPQNNTPVNQFTHRAIYGVSTTGETKFAIVRTGAYVDYGFGGFIYQRENGVTLPSTGQAIYNGVMAGMRDYNGAAGLEYSTADIEIAIDFDDFNESTGTRGDAVRGTISNRKIFDIDGKDITDSVLSRIETDQNITLNNYPVATFTVAPGVLDNNGELLGNVQSYYVDSTGTTQVFETGKYYAVIAGDNADEIAGVVVLETGLDPVATSVRDAGGFIVYR